MKRLSMKKNIKEKPKGVWLRKKGESIIIGTRLKEAILINGIISLALSVLLIPLIKGLITFNLLLILTGIPATIPSLWFWKNTLIAAFGHIEIHLEKGKGRVFSGIGWLRYSKKFNCADIKSIDIRNDTILNLMTIQRIQIETIANSLEVGTYIKKDTAIFITQTLSTFIKEKKINLDAFDTDLMEHFVELKIDKEDYN